MDIVGLILKEYKLKEIDISSKILVNHWVSAYDDKARFICENILKGKCFFRFLDSKEFNAVAVKYDPVYFVGVNYGLFSVLSRVSALFVKSGIFPGVGNVEDPVWVPDGKRNFKNIWDLIISAPFPWIIESEGWGQNQDRVMLFNLFLDVMFSFVFFHELGHIVNGHCDRDDGIISDTVISRSLEQVPDAIAHQARELIADSFSIDFLLKYTAVHIRKTAQSNVVLARVFEKLQEAKVDENVFVLACLYVFFRIADLREWEAECLGSLKHPPPPFRFNNLLAMVMERFKDERLIQKVRVVGEAMLNVSFGIYPDDAWLGQMASPEYAVHYKLILAEIPKWRVSS